MSHLRLLQSGMPGARGHHVLSVCLKSDGDCQGFSLGRPGLRSSLRFEHEMHAHRAYPAYLHQVPTPFLFGNRGGSFFDYYTAVRRQ